MLTSSPLDDGSSLETAGSGPEQTHPPVDEASLVDDNDDWGMVTDSGVLILEGEEGGTPDLLNEEGDNLSVPGTDSLPTIVGSVDALPPTEGATDNDNEGATAEESTASPTPPSDFQEKTPSIASVVFNKPKVLLVLLVASISLVCMAAVFVIIEEVYADKFSECKKDSVRLGWCKEDILDLNGSYERLETEKFDLYESYERLKKEKFELDASYEQLKKEKFELDESYERLKKEKKKDEKLRWDDYKREGAVLMDNCWVKADVELGDCAKDTKESIKDFYVSLLDQFLNVSAPFMAKDTEAEDEFEVTVNKIMNKMDSFGKSLWKSFEATSAERDRKVSEFFSKMDDHGKSWFKAYSGSQESSEEEGSKGSSGMASVKDLVQMMTAGESVVTRALEMAKESLDMNETEVLGAVQEFFKDSSLTQHAMEGKAQHATDEKQ